MLLDLTPDWQVIAYAFALAIAGTLAIAGIGQYAVIAFDMRRRTRSCPPSAFA